MRKLTREEGIHACYEGAATLAGMRHMLNDGLLDRNEIKVIFVSGSGAINPQSP